MRVVYKNPDNSISVLMPSDEALSFATIEQIAVKDTPESYPFIIVEDTDIPTDASTRDAWEWDPATVPDGVGGASNEFPEGVLP